MVQTQLVPGVHGDAPFWQFAFKNFMQKRCKLYPRQHPMCNHQLVMEFKAMFSLQINAGANENLYVFTEEKEAKVFHMGKGDNTLFSGMVWVAELSAVLLTPSSLGYFLVPSVHSGQ